MNHLIQWDTKIDMLLIIYLILYFPSSYFQTGIKLGGYYLYINISHMGVMPQVILGEEKNNSLLGRPPVFLPSANVFFYCKISSLLSDYYYTIIYYECFLMERTHSNLIVFLYSIQDWRPWERMKTWPLGAEPSMIPTKKYDLFINTLW